MQPCGAKRKNETYPCTNPRETCQVHCGAKTRNDGVCSSYPMPNSKCRLHGGLTPSGAASPHYRGKGFSKHLTANLKGKYEAAMGDDDLIQMVNELALIRSMIADLLEKGESGRQWFEVRDVHQELKRAMQSNDTRGTVRAMTDLERIVAEGTRDWQHRLEVLQHLEAFRKMADTRHKHLVASRWVLTQEQLAVAVSELYDVLIENVKDRKTLDAITRGWHARLGTSSPRDIEAASLN